MKHFTCECGSTLFFENSVCLACQSAIGYDVWADVMRRVGRGYVRCRNGADFEVCNWIVPEGGAAFCPACQLNHTVPDLTVMGNREAWHKMEAAKRRVIYTLARLEIPPASKVDTPEGVAFDFLAPTPQQRVTTGHENGIITLNILEADDAYRERERNNLREPYRTLVGHFRHEIGHYYWDRFFRYRSANDPLVWSFRALFGDERTDYTAALGRHYQQGPPANWQTTHITAYAASHPWEDWAETWAHYLHIMDGVETARAFGWRGENVPLPFTPFQQEEIGKTWDADPRFLEALNGWARLAPALNEIAASLGHADLFPFVFSSGSVQKIAFVDKVITEAKATWPNARPAAAERMAGAGVP